MAKQIIGKKTFPMLTGVMIGVGVCVILMIAGASAAAALILNETFGQAWMQYINVITHMLAVAVGSAVAARLVGHKKMLACAMTTGIYLAVLLMINAVFFGGTFHGVIASVLAMLAGIGISAVLLLRPKRDKKKYKIPTYR